MVVPAGPKHLLLAGADAAGGATVTSYAARGKQLDQQEVELGPDAGADLALPDDAVLVTVTPQGTSVRAAVLLTGTGTAVVPLRELVLTSLVPDVRPGRCPSPGSGRRAWSCSLLSPLSSRPTLSPAVAESSTLRNISTPVTVVVVATPPSRTTFTSIPTRTVPDSTRPVTTVPRP